MQEIFTDIHYNLKHKNIDSRSLVQKELKRQPLDGSAMTTALENKYRLYCLYSSLIMQYY